MSQVDQTVYYTTQIEACLEDKFGASGRGLFEKAVSVESALGPALIKQLREIAHHRNKMMHQVGYQLPNPGAFFATCQDALNTLVALHPAAPTPTAAAQAASSSGGTPTGSAFERGMRRLLGLIMFPAAAALAAYCGYLGYTKVGTGAAVLSALAGAFLGIAFVNPVHSHFYAKWFGYVLWAIALAIALQAGIAIWGWGQHGAT